MVDRDPEEAGSALPAYERRLEARMTEERRRDRWREGLVIALALAMWLAAWAIERAGLVPWGLEALRG